jgi:FkbM family methyltransferase
MPDTRTIETDGRKLGIFGQRSGFTGKTIALGRRFLSPMTTVKRRLSVRMKALRRRLSAHLKTGDTEVTLIQGTIVQTTRQGEPISFFVRDRYDLIQSGHLRGMFYENEELALIDKYFPRGGVFLDVGSNVGNHAIYVGKFLNPLQIILIEPNPPAVQLLRINVDINRLGGVADLSLLGVGLSDSDGWASAHAMDDNLGGTRLKRHDSTSGIRLARGDDVLAGRQVDFIKMDVEGMEIKALSGLRNVIRSNRPTMFIEVDDINASQFVDWTQQVGYVVEASYKRYPTNENFLVVPAELSGRNA